MGAEDLLERYEKMSAQLSYGLEEYPVYALPQARIEEYWDSWAKYLFKMFARIPFLGSQRSSLEVDFLEVLHRLSLAAHDRNYHPRLGGFSYRTYQVNPGDTIISLGYLGGSFFSLVHILHDLVDQKVLDESFRIIDPKTLIVINGDFSAPSPFWMYTFDLLATLLEKNPDQMILLRGRYERFSYWEDVITHRAYLKRLGGDRAVTYIPYAQELNVFFNGLPDALRVVLRQTGEEIIFSHQHLPAEDIGYPNICFWIASRNNAVVPLIHNGFAFNRFQSGVAQWILLSAPDFERQHEISSYLTIPVGEKFEKVCGVYRYGNRRDPEASFSQKRYALTFGIEMTDQDSEERLVNAERVFVCATADLTGGTALVGDSVSLGVQTVLLEANQKGTCAPYLFRHVVFDDQYTPSIAQKNIKRFRDEYQATYVLAPQGSPTLSSYINLVRDKKFTVLFSESGATQFRSPDLPYIVNLRPSFLAEVNKLVAYITKKYVPSKIAAVYQDDAFGNPLFDATKSFVTSIKERPPELISLPYVRGQASFEYQNELIKETNAAALGYYITSAGPALGFFGGDMTVFLKGRHVFFVLVDESILRVLQGKGIPVSFSSSVPDPHTSRIDMVESYRDLFGKNYPLSTHSLLGFISGKVFIAGVQRLLEKKMSIQGPALVQVFEEFQGVDILGMDFSFDPTIRSFKLPVWIHQENGAWLSMDEKARL